jgi:branched-chain amino acid transport system ATP-binding protein
VKDLLQAVAAINGRGTTVLMAEQNAQAALSIVSRGYVIENGQLVLAGSREELLGNEAVRRAYLGM